MTAGLFDHHRKLLRDRGISDDVIAARGYSSTVKGDWLRDAGFSRAVAALVPGLVIPVYDYTGDVRFFQYRPDHPRTNAKGKLCKYEVPQGTRLVVDVPPMVTGKLADPARPLFITESPLKADSAVSHGLVCVGTFGVWGFKGANSRGGKTLLADWEAIAVNGRYVYLAPDSDVADNEGVALASSRLGEVLAGRDANVRYVYLRHARDGAKTGLDDWLARRDWLPGTAAEGLMQLADDEPPRARMNGHPAGVTNTSGSPPPKPVPVVPAMTIAQVEAVYDKWLDGTDSVTTRVCHAVYVANMVLAGDPVWVFLVGGSGQGKTERLAPLSVMPHVEFTSTLSGQAALLSATARRDRAEHAHGGLLRKIGDRGLLVIKDFTSILEMDRTSRGEVLAALREVYDGRWDREVGAEGGQTLTWEGKCGLLAASTTAIDKAHTVINDMGPRSLFVRLKPADPKEIGRSALDHMGRETAMRKELAEATAGLLTHLPGEPHPVEPVKDGLIGLAALVALARSPVHRDWGGEVELVGDAEAPTRIVKQLGQLWRACGVLGLAGRESWEVVRRCALDSVPKLRGQVIRYLAGGEGDLFATPRTADTTAVRTALSHPQKTVRRALDDLAAHGVVDCFSPGRGHADTWSLSERASSWVALYEGEPEMLVSLLPPPCTSHPHCDQTPQEETT